MDPLSIAASCVGITAGIATLAERITQFVSSVREARKDMDAVRRELGSLQLSLSALSDEDARFGFDRTPLLKENLVGVLSNCGGIVNEISKVLEGMEGDADGKLGMGKKLKWATTGKGEMTKLRMGLEAHKSALDIALDLIAISITADIKQDTSDLKEDTGKIKEDTDQILQEIGNLQIQVAQMEVSHDRGFMMKRFLESSVTYAESVANLEELDDPDEFERPPKVPDKILEDQYSRKEDSRWHSQPPSDNTRTTPPNPLYTERSEKISPDHSNSSVSYWRSLPQGDRDVLFLEAAKHGNLRRMSLLLSSGANIDVKNADGKTSVYVVIEKNQPVYDNCLQFLLENGASIEDNSESYVSFNGNTNAFSLAYNLGNQRAMEIIMNAIPENTNFKPFYDLFMEDSMVTKESSLEYGIVLSDYEPNTKYAIALKKGAAVSEVRIDHDGFAVGWSRGKYGRFPANVIKPVHPDVHKDIVSREAQELLPVWRIWTSRSGQSHNYAKFVGTCHPENRQHRLVDLQVSDTLTKRYPIYWFCYADLLEIERQAGMTLADEVAKAKAAAETAFKDRPMEGNPVSAEEKRAELMLGLEASMEMLDRKLKAMRQKEKDKA